MDGLKKQNVINQDQPVYPAQRRRNQSRLEQFHQDILAMRGANWPYSKIADWLATEHSIHVSFQSVAKFCRSRKIQKGLGHRSRKGAVAREPQEATVSAQAPVVNSKRRKKTKVFHYEERPLATRFNGRLPTGSSSEDLSHSP